MAWLKEHGMISNYEDYLNLPLGILEDCRLLMEAAVLRMQWEMQRAKHR